MISGGYKKYNCLQPVYNVESKSITKKRGLKKVNKIKNESISRIQRTSGKKRFVL